MDQTTEHVDSAERALAKEFSDYLASVSREIIDPISANVTKHQSDIEKLYSKVADARIEVQSEFQELRGIAENLKKMAESLIAVHDETRNRLFKEFSELSEVNKRQIEVLHQSLQGDVASRFDQKSKEVIDQISARFSARLTTELTNVHKAISIGFEKTVTANKQHNDRFDRMEELLRKLTATNTAFAKETQGDFFFIRNLLIGSTIFMVGAAALAFYFRIK